MTELQGLSGEEASRILSEEGYNELPEGKKRTTLHIIFEVIKEPMFLLLLSCGTLYFFLGEFSDAAMLSAFVFFVIGITVYQERKVENALEALKDLSSPRALVIRDGEQKRIAGREVVRGDIVVLSEGDRVPADGALVFSSNLTVDESLLTGESAPVLKSVWHGEEISRPGGENLPFAYSGTLVISGYGLMKVIRTGVGTEMGKIGQAMESVGEGETLLQKESKGFVKKLSFFGLFVCALVVLFTYLFENDIFHGLLSGLSLAMAILPEEIPVVLAVFLALGAWRISKNSVLTRKLQAIHSLGSTTVLCVDKTGTLTMNKMALKSIFNGRKFFDLEKNSGKMPGDFHDIVEYGVLASRVNPVDPMEKALYACGEVHLNGTEHIHRDWILIHEYPLSKELFALSYTWKSPQSEEFIVAAKGAPEAVFDLCHLTKSAKVKLSKSVNEMSERGMRVLGVAKSVFKEKNLPKNQHDFNFQFLGLLGFIDPVRPTVPKSVREAKEAGVRIIMMTGDYAGTAENIARTIGLENPGKVVTGSQLQSLSEKRVRELVKDVNVFARMIPEQKLILVNALKKNGEVVAMTGDGVNDAPALKSAHVGIAMGERGTEVAREASDIVLINDDFSSIIQAIRMGRRIFDNLQKAIAYVLSVHLPIIGLALISVFFGFPSVLLPAHIAFLELLIDPACSVVFEVEPEEKNIMKKPPRGLKEPLFDKRTVSFGIVQGLVVLAVTLATFLFTMALNRGEAEVRSFTFVVLVLSNIGLILSNLSRKLDFSPVFENRAFRIVTAGAFVLLALVIYVPGLSGVFHFSVLHFNDVLISLGIGAVSLLALQGMKFFSKT